MGMILRALGVTILILLMTGFLRMSLAQAQVTPTETCMVRLSRLGIDLAPYALTPKPPQSACLMVDPVILVSVADPSKPARHIKFPDKPALSCEMAERMARFTADLAAPLALGIFGKPLESVSTGPGHECRPRNRQAGAKMSSHGQGNAVDIMGVVLQGDRKLMVEQPADDSTRRYFAGLRAAACGVFTTVLGPGADAAHANHLHFDIEKRGRDGQAKFCQ